MWQYLFGSRGTFLMFKYPENAGLQRLQYPPAMTRTYPCHDDPGRYQQNCGEDAHPHQPLPQQILLFSILETSNSVLVPWSYMPSCFLWAGGSVAFTVWLQISWLLDNIGTRSSEIGSFFCLVALTSVKSAEHSVQIVSKSNWANQKRKPWQTILS